MFHIKIHLWNVRTVLKLCVRFVGLFLVLLNIKIIVHENYTYATDETDRD